MKPPAVFYCAKVNLEANFSLSETIGISRAIVLALSRLAEAVASPRHLAQQGLTHAKSEIGLDPTSGQVWAFLRLL